MFCAVWSGDPARHELLRDHVACLEKQSVPVETVYVFDSGDTPPDWLAGTVVASPAPLTIYQAWNLAVQHATTEHVLNLNLDDRLAPDAIETMESFARANDAALISGDWAVRYSQEDTDAVVPTYPAHRLPFDPQWPPPVGTPTRLGSGTGERGTLGPATLWRRDLHESAPYPWQFADGSPIRIVGDLAWWTIVRQHLNAPVVRLPLVIGHYHSHPADQAEFRSADEHQLLATQGINLGWFPATDTTVEHR